MKILGIIPARGGSKRTPGKNIKLLAGKPLIAYTIEAAQKSKYIDKIIISTEDTSIAEVAASLGAEIIIRPEELATDTAKTAPVIEHAIDEMEKHGYIPDIIVLLQATCPLRDEKVVDEALERLINSGKDSIFTAAKLRKSMPLWKRSFEGEATALYDYHFRPRHQDTHLMEDIYSENGALYAIKFDAFKKHKDFLGESVEIYEMTSGHCDIDTPEDFAYAEQMILERQNCI